MPRIPYCMIKIKVMADAHEINTGEYALSNAVGRVANSIEDFLKRKNEDTEKFSFEVDIA